MIATLRAARLLGPFLLTTVSPFSLSCFFFLPLFFFIRFDSFSFRQPSGNRRHDASLCVTIRRCVSLPFFSHSGTDRLVIGGRLDRRNRKRKGRKTWKNDERFKHSSLELLTMPKEVFRVGKKKSQTVSSRSIVFNLCLF